MSEHRSKADMKKLCASKSRVTTTTKIIKMTNMQCNSNNISCHFYLLIIEINTTNEYHNKWLYLLFIDDWSLACIADPWIK